MKAFRLILDMFSLVLLPLSAFMVGNSYFDYAFPLCASFTGLLWSLLKLHRRTAS